MPSTPLAWVPYVVALIGTVIGWKMLPARNAETVGETLGAMVDRLTREVGRLDEQIARMQDHERRSARRIRLLETLLQDHDIVVPLEDDPEPAAG